MDIKLKNIGIVKESSIALDGLTVITGKNNSGKTTVGKALYSLIDGVSNLEKKVDNDKHYYIYRQLNTVESALDVLETLFRANYCNSDPANHESAITYLFNHGYLRGHQSISSIDFEGFAHQLLTELRGFDYESVTAADSDAYVKRLIRSRFKSKLSVAELLKKQIDEAISILETVFINLNKDPESIEYAKKSIEQTLLVEFSGQIQPVRETDAFSSISIIEGSETAFNVSIRKNRIVEAKDKRVYFYTPLKRAFFIDDPFIIDSLVENSFLISTRPFRNSGFNSIDTVFNSDRIGYHSNRLRSILSSKPDNTIWEKTILEDELRSVYEKMNAVLPGSFEISSDGSYYVQDGAKLQLTNLATGSKTFSIIKMLLEKGELDHTTALILDEPEAHLHPQWQNAFAEIIVLLAKELGVKVLLTTHSPNFMLAIDANMRKYDFSKKTNFYQTKTLDSSFVEYHCVNDSIEEIYGDFLQYLSEVKILRDSYLYGMGE